jgi:hypothetical protein
MAGPAPCAAFCGTVATKFWRRNLNSWRSHEIPVGRSAAQCRPENRPESQGRPGRHDVDLCTRNRANLKPAQEIGGNPCAACSSYYGGERRKSETDNENDREPDPPHGHLGWLAGV